MTMRMLFLGVALAGGLALGAGSPASAGTTIISGFNTGASTAQNVDFVNTGGGNASFYTISSASSDTPGATATRFSFFNDPTLPDYLDLPSLFTLNATVTSTPAGFDGATYTQVGVSGNMSFVYNGPNQVLDGFNLISGVTPLFSVSFTNAWIQGDGGVGGLMLTVANGGAASFVSPIYDLSGYVPSTDEFTLHLGNVAPNFSIGPGGGLASFKAHIAGEFQAATVVPEPGTWALMILGMFGAGGVLRSRRRRLDLANAA